MLDPLNDAPGITHEIFVASFQQQRREARREMMQVQTLFIRKQAEYMNVNLDNYPHAFAELTRDGAPGGVLSMGQLTPFGHLMCELSAGDHVPNTALGECEPTPEQKAELERINKQRAPFRYTSHVGKTYVPPITDELPQNVPGQAPKFMVPPVSHAPPDDVQ